MSMRTVNLLLLACLIMTGLSGLGSFLVGHPDGRWVFWIHRIASLALVPLMFWKAGIMFRSYLSRGVTISTIASTLGLGLFVLTFAYGVLWATVGVGGGRLPVLGSTSGLGLHVTFALLFAPLLIIHVIGRWSQIRGRMADFQGRRMALRYAGLGLAGVLLWRSSEAVTQAAEWSGRERRFTGSKPRGVLSGNDYPTVNWLSDPRPEIELAGWHLVVDGLVERELRINAREFDALEHRSQRAILDCTGGWYTDQRWSGVSVAAILERAGTSRGARSVVFHSQTGYRRRFSLEQTETMLLAREVTGEPLSRGHGYPVRLVAPGHRGFAWVKWVVRLEVSELPAWFESPLPLQ